MSVVELSSVRDRLLLFGGIPMNAVSSAVLFAGGGGTCLGIQWATGVSPFLAVNHSPAAIAMHAANHPDTIHICEDIRDVDPRQATRGRRVRVLGASPDCTHFSLARGGVPKSKKIRGLAWQVTRWAAQTSPDVIVLENVRELVSWGPLTRKWRKKNADRLPEGKRYRGGQPIKAKAGETFRAFIESLRKLGYDVAWWMLAACDYGTPTTRERLVLVARRDGLPITKPPVTHAPKDDPRVLSGELKPYRTAAECIDFSLPMCSIFATRDEAKAWAKLHKADGVPQRPLAPATMARIREGMGRFVLGPRRPFVVNLTHGGRVESVDEPAKTITAANRGEKAAVSPIITKAHSHGWDANGSGVRPADAPLGAIVAKDASVVAAASLLNLSHGGRPEDIEQPANVITAHPKGGDRLLLAAGLVNTRNGERPGQAPRVRDLEEPAPTVTAQGSQGAIAAAWCVKNYGGPNGHQTPGSSIEDPCPTISARDSSAVGVAFLDKLYGSALAGQSVDEPAPTVTAGGNRGGGHTAVVQAELQHATIRLTPEARERARKTLAFLTVYYSGGGTSSAADDPAPTVVTKARLGLVTVTIESSDGRTTEELASVTIDGEIWIIVDIAMRMLTPRELARCQGFPDSYVLTGTKSEQIARIGNSFPPQLAEAAVRANLPTDEPTQLAAK